MTVAVIICTYNRPALLARCLESVGQLTTRPDRVIVVDNAGQDTTRNATVQAAADYVVAPEPGLSRARNVGVGACQEDFLAFADDDMVLHPDWLSNLLAAFADESVACVTGPVLPLSLVKAPSEALGVQLKRQPWGPMAFRVDSDVPDWFERAHFGGLGDGNFALRRSALDGWTGFEERIGRGSPLGIGGEEHYAFFQLLARHHTIAYAPGAIVFHPVKTDVKAHSLQSMALDFAYAGIVALEYPRYAIRLASFFLSGAIFGRHRRRWQMWAADTEENRAAISHVVALRALVAAIGIVRQFYSASPPCGGVTKPQVQDAAKRSIPSAREG